MENQTGVAEGQGVAAPITDDIQPDAVDTGVQTDVADQPSEGGSQEKPDKDPVEGLKEGIKAERDKRQAAETRSAILEQELNSYKQRTVQPQSKPPDPFEGLEDVDLVNVKAVKDFYGERERQLNSKIDAMRVSVSTQFARQKYSDFDQVIPMLGKVANQTQMGYILSSDNPADVAYNFIKASPQYQESLTKQTVDKTVKETVDIINQHSNRVKTLSNSGAGSSKSKPVFESMPDKDFNKVVDAVLQGQTDVLKQYFGG